jgi:nicotinate phosphoribosyltransferase
MAPSGLLTDLYELNMAASYLRRGMDGEATFSLFVRQLPPTRGFLVAAGLEACLAFLESFGFAEEELDYLGRELGFEDEVLDALGAVAFSGDVWAVPEGRIVYANEPLLELTAPIAVAQLVEPYLLNQITFQTTIASKAARCVIAADGRDVVDFSLRRTQGLDAAVNGARVSSIVGFVATSNVEAARRWPERRGDDGPLLSGPRAEADAFRTFAQDLPTRTTFLVDTYDTLNGVRVAIEVIRELGLRDHLGVRLDSGDLLALSQQTRALLDEADLPDVRIFASGGLDELEVDRLVREDAPIDAFGVGTRMGVSADAPSLDSAYKLVEYDGRPMVKLSTRRPAAASGLPRSRRRWSACARAAARGPRTAARPGDGWRRAHRPAPDARDLAWVVPRRPRARLGGRPPADRPGATRAREHGCARPPHRAGAHRGAPARGAPRRLADITLRRGAPAAAERDARPRRTSLRRACRRR